MLPFPFSELNPRLELGMLSHPAGTYFYIPSKSPFEKGRLRGSRVHDQHIHIEKQKDSLGDYPFIFQELNPRLELGTPSLRVKCSTTELIQPLSLQSDSLRLQIS